jgi:type VI secretion system protein ImpH
MAAPGRRSSTRLIDRLLEQPEGFELFEAVRIIEEEAARKAVAGSLAPPPRVGSQDPEAGLHDPVRFRATLDAGFPGGAITACCVADGPADEERGSVVELDVASFGLVGPSGVLPRHYTTLVNERLRRFRDKTLRDFLDLFGHRAVSLLVRAWAKYRLAVQHDPGRHRPRRPDGGSQRAANTTDDPFGRVLVSLVGLGTPRLGVDRPPGPSIHLHYAGTLSRRIPAALPLEQLIGDAWQIEARIDQFVGRWLLLDPADQTRLRGGATRAGDGRLGIDAVAGSRVWSVEAAFRVRLGPLSWSQFRSWLPDGDRLGGLARLVRYHAGLQYDITISPVLRADEVPQCRIGGDRGGRLGWTTWLISRPLPHDAADAEFAVQP